MASIYTDIVGDTYSDKTAKAVQEKNAGTGGNLGSATIWGAILDSGGGKSTTYTQEGGGKNTIIIAVLALVAIVLLMKN